MTMEISSLLPQYKCPHCGALDINDKYNDVIGVCKECKKEYNKKQCFIKYIKRKRGNVNEDAEELWLP